MPEIIYICFLFVPFVYIEYEIMLYFILRYLKILVAIFLFEHASTFLTSLSPLKEYEMWLFLVHILFVCFF